MSETTKQCNLFDVKNNYILKWIFNNFDRKYMLEIIRYNKSIQTRLDKDIKDYQKVFGKIEIEITPVINIYGKFKFINYNKKNESFYHIYFNENKDEEKKNVITQVDKVKKIKVIIDHQIQSLKELFKDCICIEKIHFVKFSRTDIKYMNDIFSGCVCLKELKFLKFKTNNICNMSFMFNGCSSLEELDLTNFNTNNVINMSHMFSGCSS